MKNEWNIVKLLWEQTYWMLVKKFSERSLMGDENATEHIHEASEIHAKGLKELNRIINETH